MKHWLLMVAGCVLWLVGCGGGSGSSGGSPNLQVSPQTISFNTGTLGTPNSVIATGTVQNYSGTLYILIAQTANGIDQLAPPALSGNSGSVWVTPKSAQIIGKGYYQDTITVFACSDSNCNNQLGGSPQTITVDYTVVLGTLPKQLSFTAPAGTRPDAQTVIFSIYDRTKSWASSYQFLDAVTGWLDYTPPSGTGGPLTITVQPFAVPLGTPPGTYRANIIFGADGGAISFTLPINYTIT